MTKARTRTPKQTKTKQSVGAAIRARREALNMTQDDLAAILNLPRSKISQWETGAKGLVLPRGLGDNGDQSWIQRIAAALGCRVSDLVEGL